MNRELEVAQTAAKEAGKIVLQYYKSDYEIKDKGFPLFSFARNPVTSADYASNDYLKNILLSEFPDYGWFSEETADSPNRLTKERVWIVDPLDGTIEFIEGIPQFVISIALVEGHLPILGVLLNPVSGEIFTAAKEKGSTLNGELIQCSSKTNPGEMVVANSRSETRNGLWKPYKHIFSELKPVGSVAYKLGFTAAGKVDVFASLRPKNEWDICAGHCLINEAGGRLIDLKGQDVTYNKKNPRISPGLIAGNPLAVDQMLDILKK